MLNAEQIAEMIKECDSFIDAAYECDDVEARNHYEGVRSGLEYIINNTRDFYNEFPISNGGKELTIEELRNKGYLEKE